MKKIACYLEKLFDSQPLRIVEVGSRMTARNIEAQEPYYSLKRKQILGFEPDPEAYKILNRVSDEEVRFFKYALGRENHTQLLHITRNPRCSSLYEPNPTLLRSFSKLEIALEEKREEVEVRRLDSILLQETNWGYVDLLKADVQGAELDVLVGAGEYVKKLLAVVVEVEFAELYKGQPLFFDVHPFLLQQGFNFHHFIQLGGAYRNSKGQVGQNQILWGEALYFRDLPFIDHSRLVQFAVIASLYDCHHLSVEALMHQPFSQDIIESYVKHLNEPKCIFSKGKRLLRSLVSVIKH